jgi:hypothetical protein
MASWLNTKQSQKTKCIRKRCTKMIFRIVSNSRALDEAKLGRLDVCREGIRKGMLNKIKFSSHTLHPFYIIHVWQLDFDFRLPFESVAKPWYQSRVKGEGTGGFVPLRWGCGAVPPEKN